MSHIKQLIWTRNLNKKQIRKERCKHEFIRKKDKGGTELENVILKEDEEVETLDDTINCKECGLFIRIKGMIHATSCGNWLHSGFIGISFDLLLNIPSVYCKRCIVEYTGTFPVTFMPILYLRQRRFLK